MGKRLSKIYTRTGDDGTTGLGDGSRLRKDDPRIECYGTLDELNSHLGFILALEIPPKTRELLTELQHLLFDLGGELCIPGVRVTGQAHIDWLEKSLDQLNASLPNLKEFILPGGNQAAAACHIARTVCRRCERIAVSLAGQTTINSLTIIFLNRLSDLLFVVARVLARTDGGQEVLWNRDRICLK
ncbi:MAG: cob(I)yrinic acid a,c-diamide adenosyltransferase [Methylococcaceae bacterium]|nr:cob(I)yrinic acid a,c-diamide adenosyltransferase [Methylococcaceae bacterium]